MARLSFKLPRRNKLGNFTQLAGTLIPTSQAVLLHAANEAMDVIKEEIDASSNVKHPLSRIMDKQEFSLKDKLSTKEDEKGDIRVGFFDMSDREKNIIYSQEFGGRIRITPKMRAWFNTMAYRTRARKDGTYWEPTGPNLTPINRSAGEMSPLRASTTSFSVPARGYLRNSFARLGISGILANRLRFALASSMREGRIQTGSTLSNTDNPPPAETDQTL